MTKKQNKSASTGKPFQFPLMLLGLAVLLQASIVCAQGAMFQEDFSTAPTNRGWQTVGATTLFYWNGTNQNLEVTWDSSQTNTYYCHPLGTILAGSDDFS